jgi:hypothetical protein
MPDFNELLCIAYCSSGIGEQDRFLSIRHQAEKISRLTIIILIFPVFLMGSIPGDF